MSEDTEPRYALQSTVDDLTATLRTLTEQFVTLTKHYADMQKRLQFYEAHVPSIKQAKLTLDRGRKNGLIVVQEL